MTLICEKSLLTASLKVSTTRVGAVATVEPSLGDTAMRTEWADAGSAANETADQASTNASSAARAGGRGRRDQAQSTMEPPELSVGVVASICRPTRGSPAGITEDHTLAAMTTDDEPSPAELLGWYIAKYGTPQGQSTIPFSDQLRRVLTAGGRLRAKRAATRMLEPLSRRKAASLATAPGLRVHLGCGWNRLPGWVNIDLVGGKTDLVWDITRPLPFAPDSVDVVFLEHVFEHLSYDAALTILEGVRRVLRRGGVLRVGVPDAGRYARMYASSPDELRQVRWGRPTAMLALREVFQEHGHVSAYDTETLILVLECGGFPRAQRTEAGTSSLLDEAPDLPERWDETVYVEVRRP